jgi:hypothetical protein
VCRNNVVCKKLAFSFFNDACCDNESKLHCASSLPNDYYYYYYCFLANTAFRKPDGSFKAVPDSIRILYTAGDLAPGVAAELRAPSCCCQGCRANDAPLIDDGANDAPLVVHGMPFDVFESLRLAVQSSSQSKFSQRQLTPDWVCTLAMERESTLANALPGGLAEQSGEAAAGIFTHSHKPSNLWDLVWARF